MPPEPMANKQLTGTLRLDSEQKQWWLWWIKSQLNNWIKKKKKWIRLVFLFGLRFFLGAGCVSLSLIYHLKINLALAQFSQRKFTLWLNRRVVKVKLFVNTHTSEISIHKPDKFELKGFVIQQRCLFSNLS